MVSQFHITTVTNEFEQTPWNSEGQERLVRCSLWGHKQLGTTEQLNNNCNKVPQMYWLKTIQICYFVVLEIRSPNRVTGVKSSGPECCVTSGHYREGFIFLLVYFLSRKTLGSPLDSKEIKPVSPKGNQLWIFIGRTDAEAEAPILWPPHVKGWLTGKDPDAGKDWRQKEKG